MIFQSSMGQKKSRCDVPSDPPKDVFAQKIIKYGYKMMKLVTKCTRFKNICSCTKKTKMIG